MFDTELMLMTSRRVTTLCSDLQLNLVEDELFVLLALHQSLEDNLAQGITDHNPRCCLSCIANSPNQAAASKRPESNFPMFKVSFPEEG